MRTRPFLFDCDGVLVDSEVIAIEVEQAHLAEIGLAFDVTDFAIRFMGLTQGAFEAALDHERRARFGLGLPDGFMTSMRAAVHARCEQELRATPNAARFIEQLSGARAVASSSELDALHRKLQLTALTPYFDPHIYSGAQVACGKPAPDLFLFAAARIGARPSDCIVIEDSVNGVRAGLAAGATVWGFTGGGHADTGLARRLSEAGAHAVFASFDAMTSRLADA